MISVAYAQDAAATAGGLPAIVMSALPFLLVFAVFYFVLLRPQITAAKKHAALLAALKKGDVVLTDGGLIGEVSSLKDAFAHVRLADGVTVTVAREAVRSILEGDAAKGWEAKSSKR
ncbi:MAG: preprotein translocase subunit YajC [Pseudomonas fluorescens]|nr:MAG: preprotein translocase subunit YajC [Pseudomonas fluorescens]